MPTREQLYTALQRADAAGDAEAARAIARRLASEPEAEPVEPVEPETPGQLAAEGMSDVGEATVGIGRGMVAAKQALEQAGIKALDDNSPLTWLNPLLQPSKIVDRIRTTPEERGARASELQNRIRQDSETYNEGLGDSIPAKVGEVVGGTLATLPIGGMGAIPAGTLARAGAVAGQGALGAVASTPAVTDDYATEKLGQAATGAAMGGGVSLGLSGAGKVAEALLPSNAAARVLNYFGSKANNSDFAKEGEELAKRTGVMLTPAQVSGSKTMTAAEQAARQSWMSRDIADVGDKARVAQLQAFLHKTMDRLTKDDASPSVAGSAVQKASQRVIQSLEKARSSAAQKDYGAIRELTKGKPVVLPDKFRTALKTIESENDGIGTPGADALSTFAKRQLADFSKKGDIDKIMTLRSYLSKVSGGEAKISGERQDRFVARQLLSAIDDDLEATAEHAGGNIGEMLKAANGRYRGFSQQIDSAKASPIGRVLGEDFAGAIESGEFNKIAPETVIERFSKLKPTEIGLARGMLEKNEPETWQLVKRSILEDTLEKAKQMPASEGANTAVLRPEVLVRSLADKKKLSAFFAPSELKEIEDALAVARRMSDKTGYNFSGTAGQQEMLGIMNDPVGAGKQLVNRGLSGLLQTAAGGSGSRAVAKMMTDSKGRAALLELSKLPEDSTVARHAFSYLMSQYGSEEKQ